LALFAAPNRSFTDPFHKNRIVNQFLTLPADTDDQTVSARPRNEAWQLAKSYTATKSP
jgi:hypothetical protein